MEDVVNVVDVHTMCILRYSLCFKQLCENLSGRKGVIMRHFRALKLENLISKRSETRCRFYFNLCFWQ